MPEKSLHRQILTGLYMYVFRNSNAYKLKHVFPMQADLGAMTPNAQACVRDVIRGERGVGGVLGAR